MGTPQLEPINLGNWGSKPPRFLSPRGKKAPRVGGNLKYSMRLLSISEADLSRRQFLKLTGQAAAAAAMPKLPLVPAQAAVSYPKTQIEMETALLKWLQASGVGQKLKDFSPKSFKYNIEEILHLGDPNWHGTRGYEPKTIENLAWIMYSGTRLEFGKTGLAGLEVPAKERWMTVTLPDWVVRYQVSNWMGKEVDINHPFVKERNKWLEFINDAEYVTGRADPKLLPEFIKIIEHSATPDRFKEVMADEFLMTPEQIEAADREAWEKQYKKKQKQEFDAAPPPSDEPDIWRTQSVEFENRLHRLL